MRAKATQTQDGVDCQGNTSKRSQKKSPGKSRIGLLKPFAGKVFYLDLPSNRSAELLERDIKELGGSVEKFFSKDIKYLVSNKRETKYAQWLRIDSPQSIQSSPCTRNHPEHGSDCIKSRSQGQADMFLTSRGKSLVGKAAKKKDILHANQIVSKALEWGLKIFYIDDVLAYTEKKKNAIASQRPIRTADKTSVKAASTAKHTCRKKAQGGRIRKSFIKVEDTSRHYCPMYLSMTKMPALNLKTLAPRSPFLMDGKELAGDKQLGNRDAKASVGEGKAASRKKNKDKKGGGYCECCLAGYENLMTHLQSKCHQAFSQSDAYQVLNQQVSTLRCSFTHSKTFIKRRNRSVLSVESHTGPFGRNDFRSRDGIKEEQHP
ncbi:protein DBF4 homolog A [Stigmatopora argus]